MNCNSEGMLAKIRELSLKLINNSEAKDRKINIEDHGDYCLIELKIRVLKPEFEESLKRTHLSDALDG